MDADDGGTGAHGLLGGDRADDGIAAVGSGGDTAAQTGGDTGGTAATVVGHFGKGRVAQVTRHEEMLVGSGTGQRGHGRDERRRSVGGRSVGDARNVGDLDDIGGAGEHGGSDRMGRFAGLLSDGTRSFFLASSGGTGTSRTSSSRGHRRGGIAVGVAERVFVAFLANDKPPDQADDEGDEDETTDDTTGDGTGIGATTGGARGFGVGGATTGGLDTLGGGTLVTGLTDHGTSEAILAGGARRSRRLTLDATFKDGTSGVDCNISLAV